MQREIMNLWDDIQEPALALHLHNMVVKKAYLQKEVGLYSTIEDLFESSFFPNGIANDNFSDALVAQTVLGRNDRSSLHQRQALVRNTSKDIYQLLNLSLDRFFKTKAGFMMYYDADWVPEKIPDSAVRIPSLLYLIRLINTERVVDPTTGEKRLKETELVTRPKALGQSEAALLQAASISTPDPSSDVKEAQAYMALMAVSTSCGSRVI
jgi:hypothetical protein